MKFSIIVPIYNIKKEYLVECIDSIMQQSYRDFEIILVNDGSFNGCDIWCDEYAVEYPNYVKVLHKNNEGVSEARNTGIKNSTGDYLIFVDPDDWIEKNMLELIKNVIKINSFDILNLSYISEFKNSSIKHEVSEEYFVLNNRQKEEAILKLVDTNTKLEYKYFRGEIFGSVWGKCYRKDFILQNNIKFQRELTKAQDTLFNLEAFDKAQTIIDYKQIVYHYRMVSSSITHKYNSRIFEIQKIFLKAINEFIDHNNKREIFYQAYLHRIVTSYFSILDLDVFNLDNPFNNYTKRKKWEKVKDDNIFSLISKVGLKSYNLKDRLVILLTISSRYRLMRILYLIRNYKIKKADKFEYYD